MTAPVSSCCSSGSSPTDPSAESAIPIGYWIRLGLAILLTINSLVLALSFNVSSLTTPERRWIAIALAVATAIVVGLLGWPLLVNFFNSLRQRRTSMESLFVAGIFGATAYSVASMLRGEGAIYFEVVSVLIVIYSLGSLFKAKARQRAASELQRWSPEEMQCHLLLPDGSIQRRRVSEIETGDLVRVFPGQVIPVDGEVVLGQSLIKQLNMTGEPFAVAKHKSETVHAATHCVDGTLTIRATARGTDRGIDGIADSIRSWSDGKSKTEQRSQRVVAAFFWAVASAASFTMLFWGVAMSNWEAGLLNALAVMLVACPCAIGFATPIGLWSAMVKIAGLGFRFRNGDSVFKLAQVNHVVIDKTGTLTAFEPRLNELTIVDDQFEADELLRLIAAVEQVCDHPIAKIFHDQHEHFGATRESQTTGALRRAFEIEDIQLLPGRGVRATVAISRAKENLESEEVSFAIVRQPALVQLGMRSTKESEAATTGVAVHDGDAWTDRANRIEVELTTDPKRPDALQHHVDVNIDGQHVATAEFSEQRMPHLNALRHGLQDLDVRVSLVSGDLQERVDQLGFENAVGGMSPNDKLEFVRRLGKHNQLLFVGDGVNDVSAMSASAVSIAISEGAPLATQSADGIWNRKELSDLVKAMKIARLAASTIKTNILIAIVYNSIGISLAAAGWLHPVAAAVLMLISSLTVTIRSTRILGAEFGSSTKPNFRPLHHIEKCHET